MSNVIAQDELMTLKNNLLSFKDEFVTAITLNSKSHNACIEAGQKLLDKAKQTGMNDELDKQIADYIDKTRRTLRAMNERRSPVTKTFDEIRTQFTTMEAEIDATKLKSIPHLLQKQRNMYAQAKYEAEEKIRREKLQRQLEEQMRKKYRKGVEEDLFHKMKDYISQIEKTLDDLCGELTLENYGQTIDMLEAVGYEPEKEWMNGLTSLFQKDTPFYDPKVVAEVKNSVRDKLCTMYTESVPIYASSLIHKVNERKWELERIAKAGAEEAEKLKAQSRAREAEEKQRRQEELQAREEEEKRQEELQRRAEEVQQSFDAVAQEAKPLVAAISKRIELTEARGILPIFSLWWSREGSKLTIEELRKMFRRQITYVEKLAKEDIFVEDNSVRYVTEVKAK